MENNIILDMDFDDEPDSKEQPKEQLEKASESVSADDEATLYIKKIINIGLDICKENLEMIIKITKNLELFSNCGINEEVEITLDYLLELFGAIIPSLLVGNIDDLSYSSSFEDEEETKKFFKEKRKELLKRIQELEKK